MSSFAELNWVEKMVKESGVKNFGKVLDIGSMDINGTARGLIPSSEYIGTDMMEGKGVDVVVNAHDLLGAFGFHFDTILCMNTLEHDDNFWVTLNNINTLLKKGGYLFVVTPTFGFPIHRHPKDYYRFGEDAFREVIFKGYELLNLTEVHTKNINGKGVNPCLCGFGRKY